MTVETFPAAEEAPEETKPKRKYTRKAVTAPEPAPEVPEVRGPWTPGRDDFIDLKGRAYLPARRRVQWMRQEPEPHPDWTIDTEIVEHQRGKRVSSTKVDGGYACVRANVYDETGRLISTGLKTEYSENFPDYLEKCETGAIARALAIAGYGTESALDLDEGADEGRIADAPVSTSPSVSRTSVAGLSRGGRMASANAAQIREVARLSRELGLDVESVLELIKSYTSFTPPEPPDDPDLRGAFMRDVFTAMDSESIGKIVVALNAMQEAAGVLEANEDKE